MHKSVQAIDGFKTMVGESARWNANTQCLYWIDIHQPHLYCYNALTKVSQIFTLPCPLNCFDLTDNGDLIGIMANALVKITIVNTQVKISHLKNNLLTDERIAFNDGLLDTNGHLWVGTMDKSFQHNIGKLYRISPDGESVIMDEGFVVSNGMGWSPDQTKFYFTDSITRNIYQYRFNLETNQIDQRKILIHFSEDQGFPDGLYVDKLGCIWIAGWASYHVYQYSPHGELLNKIQLPTKNLTSCCLGGYDLKTLFVTSASYDVLNDLHDIDENAGAIYYLN